MADLVKRVLMKIVADDGNSEAKLDKITAKADELARKRPDLKVKVDTAAAGAKLAVLRAELRDTAKDAGKSSVNIRNFGTALASVASGGLSGGIKDMSLMQKVMLGLNAATGLGEPLMAGLTVAVGGLSAGLVAGGLGLGAFGLVAKTVWTQAAGAATAYGAAQTKLQLATTSAQRTSALQAEKAALFGLSPPVKTLSIEIGNVQGQWKKFTNAAAPGVVGVISQGLGILPKTFSSLSKFLVPAETALSGLMGSLNKGLSSGGFKSWISAFASASGPMITNLGHAIGHIVVGIGGILKAFLPVAGQMTHGLDDITAKFAKWGTTLSGHSGFKSLMSMFKSETPLAVGVLKNLAGVIKNVVADMTGLSTFSNGKMILAILGPLTGFLDTISKNKALLNFTLYALAGFDALKKMSNGITSVSQGFTAMKDAGKVVEKLAVKLGLLKVAQTEAAVATEGETVAQGELDTAMDANPIGLIILAVAGLVIGIVELWKHSTGFRNFWKGAWKDIKAIAVDAWHVIVAQFKVAVAQIKSVLNWFEGLPRWFHDRFFDVYHAIVSAWQATISFVKSIPHRILSALANLGSMLFNLGKSAISGLWNGLKSAVGGVLSWAGGIGHDIANAIGGAFGIHFSEPSEATQMVKAGRNIALGLGTGFGAAMPSAAATMARLAAAAIPGSYGSGSGGGSALGANRYIELRITGGDAKFRSWLKEIIRVNGGDPSVIGH